MSIVHVPDEKLGPIWDRCPVCETTEGGAREIRLQQNPDVWMLQCSNCFASYAERFPTPEFLTSLYDPVHYSSPLTADTALSQRCAARILAHVDVSPAASINIVDFGGNLGTLALEISRQLQARGHSGKIQATVVDLFPGTASDSLRFITPEEFLEESQGYDIVLASAVLEHLPTMRAITQELLSCANPGAIFYARTPYDLPLANLGFGHKVRWPRHLFDFGSAFWEHFATVFAVKGKVLVSRPSLVETSLEGAPVRTLLAHILKSPEQLRLKLPDPISRRLPHWPYVGGWEQLIRIED